MFRSSFILYSKLSPYILYLTCVLTHYAALPKMIINDVGNICLKYAIFYFFPNCTIFHRPHATALINSPGFPSGHAQMFAFFLCCSSSHFEFLWRFLLFATVYVSRLYMGCHNNLQLIGGTVFAILTYTILS